MGTTNDSPDAPVHAVVITRQSLVELSRISEDARALAERVDKVFWDGKKSKPPEPSSQQIALYEMLFRIRESVMELSRSKTITVQNDVDEIDRIAGMANDAIALLMPRSS